MTPIALIGLCKIELPDTTVRFADGGFIRWGEETFVSKDALFGTLASIEGLSEGADAEVPALQMTLTPASTAAAADLSKPGYQRSRVRLWLADYAVSTGLLLGDPDLLFDGQIDQTSLSAGRSSKELTMTVVSAAERLFARNTGNGLSSAFQKSVWPGDTGHDNATGLGTPIAWGVEAPPSSGGGYSGGVVRGAVEALIPRMTHV